MSVRPYQSKDLDACLELMREFAGKLNRPAPHDIVLKTLLHQCLHEGVVLVSVKTAGDGHEKVTGLIAGYRHYNLLLSKDVLVESVWYCNSGQGIALLEAFVKEAHETNTSVYLQVLEPIATKYHKVLERAGFTALERGYLMET